MRKQRPCTGVRFSGGVGCAAALLLSLLVPGQAGEEPPPPGDARLAQAIEQAEAMIAAWDYEGAAAALAKLRLDEGPLAQHVAARRAGVAVLTKLKATMIEKISSARPRLRKGTILIPGINADLVDADEVGIAVQYSNGKTERILWKGLPAKSARRLALLVTDRGKADDCVALGLLALQCRDTAAAEQDLAEARTLGANIAPYLAPLADAALAKAAELADAQRFAEAQEALRALEAKYGKLPWFPAHKEAIERLRARAKGGASEAEAEKLYAQAAKLFAEKDLFELKPIVEKLTTDYASAQVVADAARTPSVAEMAKATAQLGKIIIVRQDGKGDAKTIQAGIDAASANSVVLVADSGFYGERLLVPKEKPGLVLKAKKGCTPIVGCERGGARTLKQALDIEAPEVTIEGLVFTLARQPNDYSNCRLIETKPMYLCLRSCILEIAGRGLADAVANSGGITDLDTCIIATTGEFYGAIRATRSIWVRESTTANRAEYGGLKTGTVTCRLLDGQTLTAHGGFTLANCVLHSLLTSDACDIRSCTITGEVALRGEPNVLVDSVIAKVSAGKRDTQIQRCDVFGGEPYVDFAKPGKGCFSSPPGFQDPARLDYRLRPTSPCRKKASDGGDLGCRYTREMLEMLQKALELRSKGVISF